MLDQETSRAIQFLIGHVEWIYPVHTGQGVEWVFRVDGQIRGFWQLPISNQVVIQPLPYDRALRAAGRVEEQSRERGEKPVNLLTEAERDTLKLLLRK